MPRYYFYYIILLLVHNFGIWMVLALEQRLGGDLVSIETEEEWNFINDEIQRRNNTNYDNKWSIGLTKKRPGIGAG